MLGKVLPSQNGCGIGAEADVGKEELCSLQLGEHPSAAITGSLWRALQSLKLTYSVAVPFVGMGPAVHSPSPRETCTPMLVLLRSQQQVMPPAWLGIHAS